MSQELEPTSPCADVLLLFPVGEVSGDSIHSEQILVPFAHLVEERRKEIITEIHIQSI